MADTDDNLVWEYSIESNGALTLIPGPLVFTGGIAAFRSDNRSYG